MSAPEIEWIKHYSAEGELISMDAVVPVGLLKSFTELVQRGANLWPDAPPEIKEFADLVTSGHVLQDYKSQDTSRTRNIN